MERCSELSGGGLQYGILDRHLSRGTEDSNSEVNGHHDINSGQIHGIIQSKWVR